MNEAGRMLDDSVERILSRRLNGSGSRDAKELTDALLGDIEDAGLPLTLVHENRGGLGATIADASVVAWRWGFHAAPLPIVDILLSTSLAQFSAQCGEQAIPPLIHAGAWAYEDGKLQLEDGSPALVTVPRFGPADFVLSLCTGKDGPVLVTLAVPDHTIFHSLDDQPWIRFSARDAAIVETTPVDIDHASLSRNGAILTSAAMCGAMERVLDVAIEYANTRKQFGKPLGKFQAIQHMLAEAASEHMLAQAALSAALDDDVAGRCTSLLWKSAKIQSSRAATVVAATAHQVMGANGFTEEHELHSFTKRLWTWRDMWGRQSSLERDLGIQACSKQSPLWHLLTQSSAA